MAPFNVGTSCGQNAVHVCGINAPISVRSAAPLKSIQFAVAPAERSRSSFEFGLHRAHLEQAQPLRGIGLVQCAVENRCNVQDLTTCNTSSSSSSLNSQLITIFRNHCV